MSRQLYQCKCCGKAFWETTYSALCVSCIEVSSQSLLTARSSSSSLLSRLSSKRQKSTASSSSSSAAVSSSSIDIKTYFSPPKKSDSTENMDVIDLTQHAGGSTSRTNKNDVSVNLVVEMEEATTTTETISSNPAVIDLDMESDLDNDDVSKSLFQSDGGGSNSKWKCIICDTEYSFTGEDDREQHINECVENFQMSQLSLTQGKKKSCTENGSEDEEQPTIPPKIDLLHASEFTCFICGDELSKKSLWNRCLHLKSCAKRNWVSTKDLLQMIAPIPLLGEDSDDDDDVVFCEVITNTVLQVKSLAAISSSNNANSSSRSSSSSSSSSSVNNGAVSSGPNASAASAQKSARLDAFALLMQNAKAVASANVKKAQQQNQGGFSSSGYGSNSYSSSYSSSGAAGTTGGTNYGNKQYPGSNYSRTTSSYGYGYNRTPTSANSEITVAATVSVSTDAAAAEIRPAITTEPTPGAEAGQGKAGRGAGGRGRGGRGGRGGAEGEAGGRGRGRGRMRENGYAPQYKQIKYANMRVPIIVDGFQYAHEALSDCYFLTHFHSDHYGGLDNSFSCGSVYCSPTTAGLVRLRLHLDAKKIVPLEMEVEHTLTVGDDEVKVVLLEANHCPGAVCLLFTFSTGKKVLHTGDFRWSSHLLESSETYAKLSALQSNPRNLTIYLDTTYCDPTYNFPPQQETICAVVRCVQMELARNPKTLFIFGAYGIGKERVFMAVAEALNKSVFVDKTRWKGMMCFDWPTEHLARLTTDDTKTNIWVTAMNHVNFTMMKTFKQQRDARFQCERVIGFQPTGWTQGSGSTPRYGGYGNNNKTNNNINNPADNSKFGAGGRSKSAYNNKNNFSNRVPEMGLLSSDPEEHDHLSSLLYPRHKDGNTIYAVPYSEHSSFSELVSFVKTFR
jgi:hypothetical protein